MRLRITDRQEESASSGTGQRVARLAAEAAAAAQVRELTTHPDVIALRVERVRAQVDALLWAGIVLGLAFTMVNVQSFAAAGAELWSPAWWVAWLLDPMVSLVLLAVLRAEQVTARYQVELPPWARRTKWLTFAATYVMNTWTSWGLDGEPLSWSGVVLHSVPPLVVFATAETGPGLRDRLTEAVRRALLEHEATRAAEPRTGVEPITGTGVEDEPDPELVEFGADPVEADPVALGLLDERGLSRLWNSAPPVARTAEQRAERLIAEGAGRRRLARELDITEYQARQLLDRTRTQDAAEVDEAAEAADEPAEPAEPTSGGVGSGWGQDVDPERVHAINGAGINGARFGTAGGTS